MRLPGGAYLTVGSIGNYACSFRLDNPALPCIIAETYETSLFVHHDAYGHVHEAGAEPTASKERTGHLT